MLIKTSGSAFAYVVWKHAQYEMQFSFKEDDSFSDDYVLLDCYQQDTLFMNKVHLVWPGTGTIDSYTATMDYLKSIWVQLNGNLFYQTTVMKYVFYCNSDVKYNFLDLLQNFPSV